MKKIIRVAGFFLVVCFLPFFRSCGDVSMGFPAAALSGDWVFDIDKINGISLAINVCVMILLSTVVIMILNRRPPGRIISSGIRGIIIYHLLILTGYFVTWPLYLVSHNWFMEYVAGLHLYSLYPLHEVIGFEWLDSISEASAFYGDTYDIKLRLHYLLMVCFWFCAGCITGHLRSRRSAG